MTKNEMAEGEGVEPSPGIARRPGFRDRLPHQRSGTLRYSPECKKPPRLVTGGLSGAAADGSSGYTSIPLAIASER